MKVKLGPDHPTDTQDHELPRLRVPVGREAQPRRTAIRTDTRKSKKPGSADDHPDTLTTMHDLALAYQLAGKLDLALPLFESTLKARKVKLGLDHTDTLTTHERPWRRHTQSLGKLRSRLPLFEQTLKTMKAKLGPNDPTILTCMNNLGVDVPGGW